MLEVETAGRSEATLILPGERGAGSAGTQPCRGVAWRDHGDDEWQHEAHFLALPQTSIGSVDRNALKIPAPTGEILTSGERPLSISG